MLRLEGFADLLGSDSLPVSQWPLALCAAPFIRRSAERFFDLSEREEAISRYIAFLGPRGDCGSQILDPTAKHLQRHDLTSLSRICLNIVAEKRHAFTTVCRYWESSLTDAHRTKQQFKRQRQCLEFVPAAETA